MNTLLFSGLLLGLLGASPASMNRIHRGDNSTRCMIFPRVRSGAVFCQFTPAGAGTRGLALHGLSPPLQPGKVMSQ